MIVDHQRRWKNPTKCGDLFIIAGCFKWRRHLSVPYLVFISFYSSFESYPFSEVICLLCWPAHHISLPFCSFLQFISPGIRSCFCLFCSYTYWVSSIHITKRLDGDDICPTWHLFCFCTCDVFFFSSQYNRPLLIIKLLEVWSVVNLSVWLSIGLKSAACFSVKKQYVAFLYFVADQMASL